MFPNRSLPLAVLVLLALGGCRDSTGPRVLCDRTPGAAPAVEDVRLGVGESAALAASESLCLVLRDDTREYVLVYVDTRPAQSALTGREAPLDGVTLSVADLAGGGRARMQRVRTPRPPLPRALAPDPGHLLEVSAPSADPAHPTSRSTPWSDGETFMLLDPMRGVGREARVLRVYGGWLVVAAFEDEPMPSLGATLDMLDAAWPFLSQTGLPLQRAAFGDTLPVTSTGSGQLLMLVRPALGGPTGLAYSGTDGTNVFSWLSIVAIGSNSTRTPTSLGSLVMHEMTHAFQVLHIHRTRPPGARVFPTLGAETWGVEGGAVLMQRELVRRQTGLSPTANYDWINPGASEEEQWYSLFPIQEGAFRLGYLESAGFLWHLAHRRTIAGEGMDEAIGAVSRGAIEGWYGHVRDDQGGWQGLTSRMRERLGAHWDPVDALLEYTLAHAMDDRTSSATFQQPAFLESWRQRPDGLGWAAHAVLRAGEGGSAEVQRPYGSMGFFELSGEGAFHLTAQPGVRWRIARVR